MPHRIIIYNEWLRALQQLRIDLGNSCEEVISQYRLRQNGGEEIVEDLVHDGVIIVEYLVCAGLMCDTPTGLAITRNGIRFLSYADLVNDDFTDWLLDLMNEFSHANDAWKERS